MAIYEDGRKRLASGMLRTPTGTADTSLSIALFSAAIPSSPSDAWVTSNELTGNGYSRQSVTLDEDSTGEEVTNDTAATFTFTGSASVRAAAVCISGTRGANDLLFGNPVALISVASGQTISCAIGDIDMQFS